MPRLGSIEWKAQSRRPLSRQWKCTRPWFVPLLPIQLIANYLLPTDCHCGGRIGPKAYVASDPKGSDDSCGTTKLHLDVTDAFNLMVWSTDSSSPAALWHIFPADSTEKLKVFLRETVRQGLEPLDPVHCQAHYLSKGMLAELASKYGVRPWTVHQRTGDMVFIPAGCAHQVSPSLARY